MTLAEAQPTVDALGWTLAQQASGAPHHIFCDAAGVSTSYATLWTAVGRCAGYLLHSTDPGDRVAVQLPNSVELIALTYACYLTGRVIVPLHSEAKLPALLAALSDCAPNRLVHGADRRWAQEERQQLSRHSKLVPATEVFAHPVVELNPARSATDQLARLVYTSGTTSAPKAVQLSHRNLSSNARVIADYLQLTPKDRGLCPLSLTYAYGNSILDSHLVAGATLVLESQGGFPARLAEALQSSRATGFSAVAATYQMLLQSGALARVDLSSLRYVTQAGSRMPRDQVTALQSALGDSVAIYAMYGQTEATSRLTYLPPDRLARKPGSVGQAIAGTELAIWNEQDEPVESGIVGDIVARGPSVMLGYWRQPAATAATITADGWLRTGDLGYLDEDGDLFITGRQREMIKSGAHRIAPAEIEEVAQSAAPETVLAAIGIPDPVLGERVQLVVYWPDGPDDHAQRSLRQRLLRRCKENLPLFKMPQDVSFAADWPETESGKLKRAELARRIADQLGSRP